MVRQDLRWCGRIYDGKGKRMDTRKACYWITCMLAFKPRRGGIK
jgi:hypothetical protein